jgi:pantoate--beta-alanine ligase
VAARVQALNLMRIVTTVAALRASLDPMRLAGRKIGFVPTMGFLHDGHLALVRASVADCDATVVSIFVNPTQFGPGEDLSSYPRDAAGDERLCREAGVDILFMPDVEEVYPPGDQTRIEPGPLAAPLCGAFRPGHFRGVATVVAKLFNMVQPDRAYFGRKDYQQSLVVRRLVADLHMPLEVITLPTVREADGMAMSSRNAYLDAGQRARALCISQSLFAAQAAFAEGERDAARLRQIAEAKLSDVDELQYLELVDARTLEPLTGTVSASAALCIAAYVGATRLIDNVLLDPATATDTHDGN